jgi:NAD(P)H-dependent flavin oxidoreductase YrpB (nitropropane dioxygenase family)
MAIKFARNYLSFYKLQYSNCNLEEGRVAAASVGWEYIVCSSNECGGHQTNAKPSASPSLTVVA